MKSISHSLFVFVVLFGCAQKPVVPAPTQVAKEAEPFEHKQGCFLLYNMRTREFDRVVNEERCRERLPACSTFKVPLAVMAFDSGALKDEHQVLKWNGQEHAIMSWNQDHNARTWLRDSVVWFSQRLTPKMGEKKVQLYLNAFQYGNRDLSGGLTQAWLNRPDQMPGLQISAYEQVAFLDRLWRDQLGVSPRAQKLAREIVPAEMSAGGFRMSGKTGSNYLGAKKDRRLGWYVAHLQKDDREWIVVTNFSDEVIPDDTRYGGRAAKDITEKLLAQAGLW